MNYADEDLRVAEVILPQAFIGSACFHAQQAAEKALKAYLAWLSEEEIPKAHDLTQLSTLIVQRGGLEPPERGLRVLNQHAVAARYPEVPPPTHAEAAAAVELAEELLAFVRQAVGADEPESPG